MLGRCAGLAPRRHPKSDKVGADIDVAKEPRGRLRGTQRPADHPAVRERCYIRALAENAAAAEL